MINKRSLIYRLFLLNGSVILAGSLLLGLLAQMAVSLTFNRIERKVQDARSWALVRYLEHYYGRNDSWDGLDDDFRRAFEDDMIRHNGRPRMHHRMRGGFPENAPDDLSPLGTSFTVLSADTEIIFSHQPPGAPACPVKDCLTYSLRNSSGETVGYLAVPRPGKGTSRQEILLRRLIGAVVAVVAALITVLTLGASGLFLRKALLPLTEMTRAAGRLSKGDFSVRVEQTGQGEIQDLGEQFNRMAESMEEADQWKRRLVADTAHELRTPLTLLTSRIEMLQDGVYAMEKEQLNMLAADAADMTELVHNLQDLSEAESPQSALETEICTLQKIWNHAVASFREDTLAKNIRIEFEGDPQAEGEVDRRKMEIVCRNLLSNALDFTPPGGTIILTAERNAEGTVFRIEDSGPGIPADQREKIFERFYRLENSRNRKFGGRGLGLAICKALVQKQGGKIVSMESRFGGAAFTVTLPQNIPAEAMRQTRHTGL